MNYKNKIFKEGNFQDYLTIIDDWKREKNKIVFTNGCFDLLHSGHIMYLNEAKKNGDKLVIGLNSDESVRRLKGENRPIKGEDCRADILAFMGEIDMVVIFDEDTPLDLITKIVPDVLVKGGDWEIENIVGANVVIENGGTVKSLNFLDGHSTTNIVNKVLNQN
ncbi:MAG: D-glycero-beta-D-manno-heptose 1-phosphate adenylyltransferase [Saprospiraceae bacterium]